MSSSPERQLVCQALENGEWCQAALVIIPQEVGGYNDSGLFLHADCICWNLTPHLLLLLRRISW